MTGNKRPLISSKTAYPVPLKSWGGRRNRTDSSANSGKENYPRIELYSDAYCITWPVLLSVPQMPFLSVRDIEATGLGNFNVSIALWSKIYELGGRALQSAADAAKLLEIAM